MYLRKKHRPPHLFLDDYTYFLSLKIYKGSSLLNSNKRKLLIIDLIKFTSNKYSYKLVAWVILNNHAHFMIKASNAGLMPKFINLISGKSAIELNKLDNTKGRKVWHQYWDHCIRNEKDYYMHLNYIHQNPVKHKIVGKLKDYEFSSYREFLEKYGKVWIAECFERYPIVDFNPIWE